MTETFERLQELQASGRNGIWPFVLRNLMRPLWLSRPGQRADVLIGNPPWIAYRHLSAEMQAGCAKPASAMNLWIGGDWRRSRTSRRCFGRAARNVICGSVVESHSLCPMRRLIARHMADCG